MEAPKRMTLDDLLASREEGVELDLAYIMG